MNTAERLALGKRRILNILRAYDIATLKMLEQKISDAGPNPQRVDPHVLTDARTALQQEGLLLTREDGPEWHYLKEANPKTVLARFKTLQAVHVKTEKPSFKKRMGQTAEIAVLKAMQEAGSNFVGHFSDLEDHDDSTLYSKSDVDAVSNRRIQKGMLDYVIFTPKAGPLGIEVKNIREWIYPNRSIMIELLRKCVHLDAVPVIVARRIHYTTFSVLNACGVIVHQFYNQLYPTSDAELAALVRDKNSLGYFDVKVGSTPDARLLKFFNTSLPSIAEESREKFNQHKTTIAAFANKQMSYAQFVVTLKGKEWHGDDNDEMPEPDDPF